MIENFNFNKAIAEGDLDEVKKYLNKGINPSDDDNFPIKMASKKGHEEVVKLLFKDKRVRDSLRKEDINGLIEIEYKLYKLKNGRGI